MSVKVASMAELDTASRDHLFVTMYDWKIHRVDRSCTDWHAFLAPESLRGSGDPGMTLYMQEEADSLVRDGQNTFCRNCCRAEIREQLAPPEIRDGGGPEVRT